MQRLLLIDTNSDDRAWVLERLEQEFPDLSIEVITTPSDLDDFLKAGNFDIIVTDYYLSWNQLHWIDGLTDRLTDGLIVLGQVKKQYPACPVIMLTCSGNEEIAVAGMKNGLYDYILKLPQNGDRLVRSIQSALATQEVILQVSAEQEQPPPNQTLEALIHASPLAITVLDPTGHVSIWNPAAERIFGWSAQEVIGRPMPTIPLERQAEFLRNIAVTLEGMPLSGMETCRRRKDGSLVQVGIWTALLKDDRGETSQIMSIVADITERKQAQAERDRLLSQLETERARLKAVLWQMPAGVIIAEAPSGKVVLGNEQVHQILRQPFTPAEGLQDHNRYEGFHPDGQVYRLEDWPLSRSLLFGEVVTDEEIEILRGDGTRGVINVSAAPIRDPGGQVVAAVTTFYDITARKRAEEADRFLAQVSRVLTASLDYELILHNLAQSLLPFLGDYCLICNLTDRDHLQILTTAYRDGTTDGELKAWVAKNPPQAPNRQGPLQQVLKTGHTVLLLEFETDFGRQILSEEPVRDIYSQFPPRSMMMVSMVARGRILGAIVLVMATSGRSYQARDLEVAQEVAQRSALAVDHARLYREAQEANRMKDEFLTILSHELRSPLNAILGWSQILQTRQLSEAKVRRALETIERNARTQTQLVDDLLDVSRIIRGELRLKPKLVRLTALVDGAIETVRPTAIAKNIQLLTYLSPTGTVVGDPDRLSQVIWNLLSNALKFTPEGGRVEVHLTRSIREDSEIIPPQSLIPNPTPSSYACITVTDTGQGISPDFLPHVFERFRQADSTTTRSYSGLGLGLAIVHHLIELHGGAVEASSPGLGQGATFKVILPLQGNAVLIESPTDPLVTDSEPMTHLG
ncbi:MAG: PAS domain S-box protein [Leptolyngbyaceae cyanobacterium bins.59]|nr:PAS domain S-box protein [Leptolyngbyaceae cyanobacterium bins.59]